MFSVKSIAYSHAWSRLAMLAKKPMGCWHVVIYVYGDDGSKRAFLYGSGYDHAAAPEMIRGFIDLPLPICRRFKRYGDHVARKALRELHAI